MLGLPDLKALTPEKRELLLDLAQFTLDIVGIFEPTPFADITSGLISLMRADFVGAAISTVSVIPYLGDLSKLGKIPKYLRSIERAIVIARADIKFSQMLQPVLRKLLRALDRIPIDRVSPSLRPGFEKMRRMIVEFLPGSSRVASRLDMLADDLTRRVFGSTQNIGTRQKQNIRTVVEFFDKHNVGGRDVAEWAGLCKGIDMHAAQPITTIMLKPGDLVAQYVETARPAGRQVGQWMTMVQGSVSHRNIGLSGHGRVRKIYRVKKDAKIGPRGLEVLKSKAAAAADHWTLTGPKPHNAVTKVNGKLDMKAAEHVAGGGDQYFLPKAWEFLEEVHSP